MIGVLFEIFSYVLGCVFSWTGLQVTFVLWLIAYIILNTLPLVLGPQDVKKKYNAEWAVVTGGSSGIGKALASRLLEQQINVVILAQDDAVLKNTQKELAAKFPKRKVVSCGCDLSDATCKWLDIVKATTDALDIALVFNNAGYILTGFFEDKDVDAQLRNFHCNATASIALTHHFYSKMLSRAASPSGRRGAVIFTSSPSGFFPNPFACMYGASKAALSSIATSLAVEGRARGVDVHAVHPSPVKSRFLTGGGNAGVKVSKLEMFDLAYKFATGPEAVPDAVLAHLGRTAVLADLGATAVAMRVVVSLLGINFLTFVFSLVAPLMPDYRANVKKND